MNKYGITNLPGFPFRDVDEMINGVIDAYLAKQDPYAHLKTAAADPTKQIRFLVMQHNGSFVDNWKDSGHQWTWNAAPENYEIRDKPKPMKKVKMLAYANDMAMFWRSEDYPPSSGWHRIPSEDKEVEVQDD